MSCETLSFTFNRTIRNSRFDHVRRVSVYKLMTSTEYFQIFIKYEIRKFCGSQIGEKEVVSIIELWLHFL